MHLVYLTLGFSTASACLLEFFFCAFEPSWLDHLLDQLHNLRQGYISIQDYIAIFKDLAHRSDVREHHSETITRFVWGLRPKIKRDMITDPYDLNTVEEAFDVTLKLDLAFNAG